MAINVQVASAGTRTLITVGLVALFTLMDLFGPQAIVPLLAKEFRTSAANVGLATNAAVIGMAISGLLAAFVADRFERKPVMIAALLLLSLPTFLIGLTSNIFIFAALRIGQGLIMCASFTVAIAYVAEEWGPGGTASLVMAAYVTGNVASNVVGRFLAVVTAQYANWSDAFFLMAAINLAGGGFLLLTLPRGGACRREQSRLPIMSQFRKHLSNVRVVGACGIGFLILFSFIGVFTYVNFLLVGPPFNLAPGMLGALYLVFIASLLATPVAGPAVRHLGDSTSITLGALVSLGGLLLTLVPSIVTVAIGLALVGMGTFFCQAVATGFTGRAGGDAKVAASGLYLASYYTGGLCGAVILGHVWEGWGWPGCVAVIGLAFAIMTLIPIVAWRQKSVATVWKPSAAIHSSGYLIAAIGDSRGATMPAE